MSSSSRYTYRVSLRLRLAQIIWRNLSLDDFNDGVSSVSFNNRNEWTGRVGARLQRTFSVEMRGRPYTRVGVLRAFGEGDSTTSSGTTGIPGGVGHTAGQLNAGLVAQVTRSGSAFVAASYLTNLGGSHQRTLGGNAGVRWKCQPLPSSRFHGWARFSARLPRQARRFAALRLITGCAVDQALATLHVCYYWPCLGALQSGVPLLFRSGVMPWPSAIR